MVVDKGYEKSAHLYDIFDNKDNITFFLKYGEEAETILDIGAGTGRIAIPLAERGVKIVCIEPSPSMRKEFLKKLQNRPELEDRITLVAGDVQTFRLAEIFSVVFLSGSFDHIPNRDRIISFQNINRHLKPNGKLIFDIHIGNMKDSPLLLVDTVKRKNYEYKRFIGTKILPDNMIDVLLVFETYKQGKLIEKIEQRSSAFTTTQTKVHQLLEETNFIIQKEYSDYHYSPFYKGDSLLIIEAIKN
ncbi:MAG: class I SAM-dependent methyltransferase [Candidatus Heimdallarchaeota archaeon]|nr:MAG: class I SAM-dependent methyltransferase [Candidatus Heimdallarchaeota archaeon]